MSFAALPATTSSPSRYHRFLSGLFSSVTNPFSSNSPVFTSIQNPRGGPSHIKRPNARTLKRANAPNKSFRIRSYAKSARKSFICRSYAKPPGVVVAILFRSATRPCSGLSKMELGRCGVGEENEGRTRAEVGYVSRRGGFDPYCGECGSTDAIAAERRRGSWTRAAGRPLFRWRRLLVHASGAWARGHAD